MLLTHTSQYAIQSLVYIALNGGDGPLLSREISTKLGAPSAYLSKILQLMCRGGLLQSHRGRRGGFSLRDPAANLNLMDIINITEGENFTTECLLGLKQCSDETACPMHPTWKPIKERIIQMLKNQTLASVADAVREGKYRLTDLPGALHPEIDATYGVCPLDS
ncbi:MAG: Rrf2 family transcriptional regulator [Methylobacillus sp.]|jgi:Rrf2 family protein|nr:Rrf2 family transcriptional regulator [Methylobacillus sp.]